MTSAFAIRDDDTSYFTSPDELDAVYAPYWGKIPVSLATVPFSVPEHRGRSFNNRYPPDAEMPLGENKPLVEWLKEKIRLGHVEIMLHGYNHLYQQINGRWIGEYGWKSVQQLLEETARGKAYLEQLLEAEIKVFVPPSNTIGKAGIRTIRHAGLNLSGIMGRGGDRPWTRDYPAAYLKRWGWRLFKGEAYPYPLALGGVKELRAYALTPRANVDDLMRSLKSCATIQAPFIIATHYWEFRDSPSMHETLSMLIDQARKTGFVFTQVSHCFNRL
ncbi:DUF2194 domain-containing protein [Salinisphaera sp. G21_0]|uniref:DUF2194 domain-containing protein n=1 Tax=Salinisphaera sp. G21_0 TaxID=2821094 RepID=UPI001ADB7933|nr:DUF2194 domain-containing protein [Salinisphaera sp. G21_0]